MAVITTIIKSFQNKWLEHLEWMPENPSPESALGMNEWKPSPGVAHGMNENSVPKPLLEWVNEWMSEWMKAESQSCSININRWTH
jgi:hypothetical protein